VVFNPTTTKTYTVTGTDANACKNTGTISVTVNALPIVTGAATTPSICIGSATTLNGSGASSYTWDNSVTDNVAFNPTTTKTYTVTGTDANGCKNTGTVSVTVNALPTVVVNGASICTGSSKALTVSGANSYSWSPNTNLSSTTGATVTANPSNTITYTVNGTDSKGCIGTDTAVVTVNNLPLVEVEGGSICSGSSKTLSATGANTYLWSPNTYLSAITGTTVTANPTDTIVYTVTGTDSKGCEGTDTATVIVKEVPPTPTFTALDSICQFNTNYSILNNVLGNDLKWYTANNATNNLPTSPQINTSIAQTNTYYVSQTIQNCESNKSVISVVVKPQPNKPRLDSMINICQNQQNINIITNNNIGNIKWFANQNDIAFSQLQPVINSATIGTQYLWASNEISNCESDKLKIQLNTLPNPSLTAITPEIICLGDTLNVNLNFDGVPNFTLVYENLGIKDTLNSQNGVNNFYLLPNHDDNIKFISLTDSYCTTTYLNFLQPYIVSQLPTVSLTAKDTICNNQSASLNIQMDIANANYQWTNDIKLPFTKAQIISQTHDQLVEQINNLSNAPQKITYTIKGYNGNCLGETKSKSIVIMPSYEPELPIDEPTICKGDDYTIEIRNPNLGYKIKWLKNDTLIQSVSNKITEKINQNTVFTLKYTDYCGSTDELIHNVYIHENQNLSKFQLIDSCLHFRSTIKATIPTYLNQTIWNFNNDADIVKTNNANETIVNYIFPTTGKNTISVKGYLNNCLLLDSNLVVDIVNCDIEVKNTFTPNDDGQNDFWEIQDIEKYPNASIEIFDRWGQKIKVINKNIPHQAWDGKNEDGTLLECGTYYYIIHCNNPILNIKGYINLYK
jgi:gliding motility-associated-like protein